VKGGVDHSNLSSSMKPLTLSEQEKQDLVAFMQSLTSRRTAVAVPNLPQ
jgi:cytochrome c peroxidase